ncbi:MAG TPA: PEP-CTERM sorting domain-containing protein [Myxococcus sp.]|nr:PEP-CTERM sorting domain-containing protein [Myxococcus sp.]
MSEVQPSPSPVEPPRPPLHAVSPGASSVLGPWAKLAHALFGVVLPLVALGVELRSGMCAENLFDPLPTPMHVLLVAAVPAANALALWVLHRRATRLFRALLWLNGVALGVSLLYSVLFLPLLPVAVIALFIAIGALPLSPLLSFISAVMLRRRLLRSGWPLPATRWWPGALAAVALLVASELPGSLTRFGVHVAVSGSPEAQLRALELLRRLASEETLLELCYDGSRRYSLVGFVLSIDAPTNPEDARRVYYRVTGRTFNADAPPKGKRGHMVRGWNDWDADRASGEVGGRVPGLSLASSSLEGSVDADAALGYIEWTMELATSEWGQHEARMLVQLPPGAVVSRVTLYINGEPREAAFASTGQVTEAYNRIVQRRMDPLLVTWRPGDRVQVQAFPITKETPMRIKLGISAPLLLREAGRDGALPLPSILERNFDVDGAFRHTARIESRRPMTALGGAKALARGDGVHEWLGSITHAQLQTYESTLRVSRAEGPEVMWSPDLAQPDRFFVRQQLRQVMTLKPARLFVVVDGSAGMEGAVEELAAALQAVPDGVELAVLAARDGVQELLPPQRADVATRALAAQRLRGLAINGGHDTTPALARAWSLAGRDAPGVVLWVHGAQPLPPMSVVDELRLSGPRPIELVDVQVAPGPNKALSAVPAHAMLRPLPRTGALREDLILQLRAWGTPQPVLVRERAPLSEAPREGLQTSTHLARLWARDEVARLLALNREGMLSGAQGLAVTHQLVTGVSGAVVLERKEQYAEAGLNPVEPGTVPTVPEPETWLMLAMACGLLVVVALRRRRLA